MNRYIEVVLPEGAENLTLYYEKIAEREGFDITDAEKILKQDIEYSNYVEAGKKECVQLADLDDGIYQIYVSGDEEYEFVPMLVSMPAWTTENEEALLYEVSITPKYTKFALPEPEQTTFTETPIMDSPKTGDFHQGATFGVLGIISFIIVVIMSCHNRFKCARMSE